MKRLYRSVILTVILALLTTPAFAAQDGTVVASAVVVPAQITRLSFLTSALVKEVYVKDNEWYTEYIKVQGKRIVVKINDKTVVDYTEPDNVQRDEGNSLRKLSNGTFALQGHDPKSKVYYKNIMVKLLPE